MLLLIRRSIPVKTISAKMHAGLDLNLQAESFTTPTETQTIFPIYQNYEEEPKPLQFYMPTISTNLQEVAQFQNQIVYPSEMIMKRECMMEEVQFVMGDGSDSVQLLVNGVETVRSATFGGGGREVTLLLKYPPPYQFVDNSGFSIGSGSGMTGQSQVGGGFVLGGAITDKKYRRMIKNRESAARSRSRRQAYNVQLQIEILNLKDENDMLKKLLSIPIEGLKSEENSNGLLRSISASL